MLDSGAILSVSDRAPKVHLARWSTSLHVLSDAFRRGHSH